MTALELIELEYLKALGTPYPVGEVINYKGGSEKVKRFDYDLKHGLMIVLESGKRLSDYAVADRYRQFAIRQFNQRANDTIKVG